jgi:hypothetical protein
MTKVSRTLFVGREFRGAGETPAFFLFLTQHKNRWRDAGATRNRAPFFLHTVLSNFAIFVEESALFRNFTSPQKCVSNSIQIRFR